MAPRKRNEPASWELDADKPKPNGSTRTRRSYCTKELTTRESHDQVVVASADGPAEPAPGIDTVHDIMLYAAKTHGNRNGFASRDIERIITEEKEVTKNVGGKEQKEMKKWNYFKLKPFDWMSYEAFLVQVRETGSGLRQLLDREGGFFNIYASTS